MIRFIDLRGQDASQAQFAFWDTPRDRFCEFAGEQAWETVAAFKANFEEAGGKFSDHAVGDCDVSRFENVMPEWVHGAEGLDHPRDRG